MSRNVILVAAIVVIAGYFYFKSTDRSQEIITSQTNQEESSSTTDDQATEAVDENLVENLIKEGIVEKIDQETNPPKVYVTALYYRAPSVDKTAILEVLYKDLRANNPDVKYFDLYDAKSGEKVDSYNPYATQTR